jgi:hypothetical protein
MTFINRRGRRKQHLATITMSDDMEIYYKDWGKGPSRDVPARVASVLRRLGRPSAVPRAERLSRRRARSARPRPVEPGLFGQRHGWLCRRSSRRDPLDRRDLVVEHDFSSQWGWHINMSPFTGTHKAISTRSAASVLTWAARSDGMTRARSGTVRALALGSLRPARHSRAGGKTTASSRNTG